MSKKLVAARNLSAGHVLKAEDIAIKSPGDGLPPYMLENLIGSTIINSIQEHDDFTIDNLNGVSLITGPSPVPQTVADTSKT